METKIAGDALYVVKLCMWWILQSGYIESELTWCLREVFCLLDIFF